MELIDREAAKSKKVYCKERHEYVVPVSELDWLPTIDASTVVHGRWNMDIKGKPNDGGTYGINVCSVCGHTQHISAKGNYCPNCGAKMDGEGNA